MHTGGNIESPVEEHPNKPESTYELIRRRWSPRSFSDQAITDQDLKLMFEAASWAASSYNEQPWRFIVAKKSDGPAYERVLNTLALFNQTWAKSAPVLVITVAKRTFTHIGTPNKHALHDTGAALAYLALQATALGLHVHGMAGFDAEKARTDLHIPADYEPVAAAAIGYLGSPDDLPEPYRERERAPRQRKPISELVFRDVWDQPWNF